MNTSISAIITIYSGSYVYSYIGGTQSLQDNTPLY